MTLTSEIVKEAYRENNIIPVGREPTDAEVAEALPRLNNIVRSLFGRTVGIYLKDWPVPPSTTAPVNARYPMWPATEKLPDDVYPYPPGNARLLCRQTQAKTVYLQQNPQDGAVVEIVPNGADFEAAPLTIDANGRLIAGALTLVQDAALTEQRRFMYRADLSSWTEIAELTADDPLPFPSEFDDYFICALNIRLSPRYSAAPAALTAAVMKAKEKDMKTRYWQSVDAPTVISGELRTQQSYGQGDYVGEDF